MRGTSVGIILKLGEHTTTTSKSAKFSNGQSMWFDTFITT